MSKVRRKGADSPPSSRSPDKRKKPSVFSRLGTGSGPRKFRDESDDEPQPATSPPRRMVCRPWMDTGCCTYGATCRFSHPARTNQPIPDTKPLAVLQTKISPVKRGGARSPSPGTMYERLLPRALRTNPDGKHPPREGREPRTEGREPRTEGREPRTEGRESRTEGRESRTGEVKSVRSTVSTVTATGKSKRANNDSDSDGSPNNVENEEYIHELEQEPERDLMKKRLELQRELYRLQQEGPGDSQVKGDDHDNKSSKNDTGRDDGSSSSSSSSSSSDSDSDSDDRAKKQRKKFANEKKGKSDAGLKKKSKPLKKSKNKNERYRSPSYDDNDDRELKKRRRSSQEGSPRPKRDKNKKKRLTPSRDGRGARDGSSKRTRSPIDDRKARWTPPPGAGKRGRGSRSPSPDYKRRKQSYDYSDDDRGRKQDPRGRDDRTDDRSYSRDQKPKSPARGAANKIRGKKSARNDRSPSSERNDVCTDTRRVLKTGTSPRGKKKLKSKQRRDDYSDESEHDRLRKNSRKSPRNMLDKSPGKKKRSPGSVISDKSDKRKARGDNRTRQTARQRQSVSPNQWDRNESRTRPIKRNKRTPDLRSPRKTSAGPSPTKRSTSARGPSPGTRTPPRDSSRTKRGANDHRTLSRTPSNDGRRTNSLDRRSGSRGAPRNNIRRSPGRKSPPRGNDRRPREITPPLRDQRRSPAHQQQRPPQHEYDRPPERWEPRDDRRTPPNDRDYNRGAPPPREQNERPRDQRSPQRDQVRRSPPRRNSPRDIRRSLPRDDRRSPQRDARDSRDPDRRTPPSQRGRTPPSQRGRTPPPRRSPRRSPPREADRRRSPTWNQRPDDRRSSPPRDRFEDQWAGGRGGRGGRARGRGRGGRGYNGAPGEDEEFRYDDNPVGQAFGRGGRGRPERSHPPRDADWNERSRDDDRGRDQTWTRDRSRDSRDRMEEVMTEEMIKQEEERKAALLERRKRRDAEIAAQEAVQKKEDEIHIGEVLTEICEYEQRIRDEAIADAKRREDEAAVNEARRKRLDQERQERIQRREDERIEREREREVESKRKRDMSPSEASNRSLDRTREGNLSEHSMTEDEALRRTEKYVEEVVRQRRSLSPRDSRDGRLPNKRRRQRGDDDPELETDDDDLQPPGDDHGVGFEANTLSSRGSDRQRRSASRSSLGSHHSHSRPADNDRPGPDVSKDKSGPLPSDPRLRDHMTGSRSVIGGTPDRANSTKSGQDDYDPISDDELDELIGSDKGLSEKDENEQIKTGLVNTLDIDWASLMKASSSPKSTTSATTCSSQRFSLAAILDKVGVSRRLAGQRVITKVLNLTKESANTDIAVAVNELSENKDSEKTSSSPTVTSSSLTVTSSPTVTNSDTLVNDDHLFKRPLGCSSSHNNVNHNNVYNLTTATANKCALSARNDLLLRRQLCRLEKDDHGLVLYPSQIDRQLHKLSLNFLTKSKQSHVTNALPLRTNQSQVLKSPLETP